jgi:hypothetical protein
MEHLNEYKLDNGSLYRLYRDNIGQLTWVHVMICPTWIGTLDTAIDYYWG